jgi:hypothetical protein
VLTQMLHDLGKPSVPLKIADDQRLLMLSDPARRDVVHGELRAGLKRAAHGTFSSMQAEHVLRRIVRHHAEIVKIKEAVQS